MGQPREQRRDEPRARNGETTGGMKGGWRGFKEGEPGRRFRDLHRWRRENARGGIWRAFPLLFGGVLAATGVLLMVIPGPGMLLFFFGLGIIGTESLLVARFMDWAEERGRGMIRRFRRR